MDIHSCLGKTEITASIRHIARLLKSGITIYNSDVQDTACRKTSEKEEEKEEKQRQLHSILRLTQAQKSATGFLRRT